MKKLDISGPKGNAFIILGLASRLSSQLNLDYDVIQKEMTAGDYDQLLGVFKENFGDYVQFVAPYKMAGIADNLYTIEKNDYI